MALLELLAGAAPARVVAADALLVGDAPRLDLRRRLGRGVRRVLRGIRDAGRYGPAGGCRGGGLQSARLVGRGAAGVVQAGLARSATAADGPLPTATATAASVAVLALDLNLNVEDVARELLPDVVHQLAEHLEALVL